MRPFKFIWDTRNGFFAFKWNGLLSIGNEREKNILRILGFPIRFQPKFKNATIPIRWFYIKNGLSFITQWRLERVEGTISFPDPMINGVLYGWLRVIEGIKPRQRFGVTINFLGKNQFSGQASISPRILLSHIKRWILPLFLEMRRQRRKWREEEKGGE